MKKNQKQVLIFNSVLDKRKLFSIEFSNYVLEVVETQQLKRQRLSFDHPFPSGEKKLYLST